jgi:hypothetical protein
MCLTAAGAGLDPDRISFTAALHAVRRTVPLARIGRPSLSFPVGRQGRRGLAGEAGVAGEVGVAGEASVAREAGMAREADGVHGDRPARGGRRGGPRLAEGSSRAAVPIRVKAQVAA